MTRTSRNEPAASAHEPGVGSPFSGGTEGAEVSEEQDALHAASFRPALPRLPTGDRWIGTRELPGYRAGCIVVKLADLPAVDAEHLYCDLMLLDAQGHIEDTLSGPCRAMHRHASLDERSIFVRMVAELLRHAGDEERGILPLGPALAHVREHGAQVCKLAGAAVLLDAACSDRALVSSLTDLLTLSLGSEEAHAVLCGVVEHLARTRGFEGDIHAVNEAGLAAQVEAAVRSLGKHNARRYLREVTDFALLPSPEMFGL